ncbi:hypothetical protein HYT53_02900 [Candidatus Woesearchaeota archaeon]|nr:hypothetical protein [Candidatus Woesearchaeota archaeon]
MVKLGKKALFAAFFVVLVLISACGKVGKSSTTKTLEELRVGTEGLAMSFLPNNPPERIHVEKGADSELNRFDVVMEVRNKGAYPEFGEGSGFEPFGLHGKIYLGGYDPNILDFFEPKPPIEDLSRKTLEGKTSINPNGGLDFATFKGRVIAENLNVEKYEPVIQATACYEYQTTANPSVCIDPNPYSTIKEKKVCEVKDTALSNQGAPVAVTAVNEEAFATKTQFRITIKNVGNGDVLKPYVLGEDKCNPFGDSKLQREDVDKVYLINVKVSNKPLQCSPFVDGQVKSQSGFIKLIQNSEGSIICELPRNEYSSSKTAYITPLEIKLSYVYRTTIEKKIQIKREVTGVSSTDTGVSSGGASTSPSPSYEGQPLPSGETDICLEFDKTTNQCTRYAD